MKVSTLEVLQILFIKDQIFTLDQPEPGLLDPASGKTRVSMKRSLRHNSKFLRLIRDSFKDIGNKTMI